MEDFIQYTIYVHAFFGFMALLSGGIAMATSKGGKLHRTAGKFYFAGMTGVFITAVFVSIMHDNPFLLMVGFFSYHMVCSGYRALYLKKLHLNQKPALTDWLIAITAGTFNILLLAWGARLYLQTGNHIGIVAMVFGIFGCRTVYADVKKFIKKPSEKNHWLLSHISGMMGGYIATWTAFLVVNIDFLPQLVVWLAPTAIGVPFIVYFTRKFKTKPEKVKVV